VLVRLRLRVPALRHLLLALVLALGSLQVLLPVQESPLLLALQEQQRGSLQVLARAP
jgi:hypothetical protein